MSKKCPGCFTWFALFNRRVNKAVRKLALEIKNPYSIPMSFTSAQTVAFLAQVVTVLKERKATTAQAVARADEAIAALEPLRAENSRINTALAALEAEKLVWLEADAREDAALEAVVAELQGTATPPAGEPAGEPVVETGAGEGAGEATSGTEGTGEGTDTPEGTGEATDAPEGAGDAAAGDDSDNV